MSEDAFQTRNTRRIESLTGIKHIYVWLTIFGIGFSIYHMTQLLDLPSELRPGDLFIYPVSVIVVLLVNIVFISTLIHVVRYLNEAVGLIKEEVGLIIQSIDGINPQETYKHSPIGKYKPQGLYLAAALMFLVSLPMASIIAITGESVMGIPFLNYGGLIMVVASILSGIGILKVKVWGYRLGLGIVVVYLLFLGGLVVTEPDRRFALPILLQIIIAISLYINRHVFTAPSPMDKPRDIQTPQNYQESGVGQGGAEEVLTDSSPKTIKVAKREEDRQLLIIVLFLGVLLILGLVLNYVLMK